MNHILSDSQLEAMIKSAVNSFGPLPPDEKFSQLVSALRELQERRKAEMDSDPVAYMHDGEDGTEYNGHNEFSGGGKGIPLYRHAQPAPVVMAEAQSRAAFEQWCTVNIERNKWHPEFYAHLPVREQWAAWEACRAAMFQAKSLTGNSPVIGIDLASSPDRTVEVRYVAPPGYVMVPKEPTDEMIAAAMNCEDVLFNSDDSFCVQFGNIYEAMLAAAPQLPGSEPATVPGSWIPVSEKLPERGDYLVSDGRDFDVQLFNGEQFIPGFVWEDKITHWMPLPAAPQEVKGE